MRSEWFFRFGAEWLNGAPRKTVGAEWFFGVPKNQNHSEIRRAEFRRAEFHCDTVLTVLLRRANFHAHPSPCCCGVMLSPALLVRTLCRAWLDHFRVALVTYRTNNSPFLHPSPSASSLARFLLSLNLIGAAVAACSSLQLASYQTLRGGGWSKEQGDQ